MRYRSIFLFFSLLLCMSLVGWGCHIAQDGFSWQRVESNLPPNPAWEIVLTPEEGARVLAILDQPFYYLASGGQCYAFASADGNYVLKLFRCHRMISPPWLRFTASLPFLKKRCTKSMARRARYFEQTFFSCYAAYQELREETGLIYLHLSKTPHWHPSVTFYDKIGCLHRADMGNMEFILQKRAQLVLPTLEVLMQSGKEMQARKSLEGLVDLVLRCCKKNFLDKDLHLIDNFGFVDGRPVQIDVGKYFCDPTRSLPEVYQNDAVRTVEQLRSALKDRFPSLEQHLDVILENIRKDALAKQAKAV